MSVGKLVKSVLVNITAVKQEGHPSPENDRFHCRLFVPSGEQKEREHESYIEKTSYMKSF